MQISDLASMYGLSGIDTSSYYDNLDTSDSLKLDETEQFNNVLQDYMTKEYSTELEQKAIEVQPTEEKETNSNYLSDLSESMMSTSSGRKVIASMIENQIMGIVTGSVDEDLNETLQSLLLGAEGESTVSGIEETLSGLQNIETQTDKSKA